MTNLATKQHVNMDIDIEVIGSAGILTLNRPDVLNASSIPMLNYFNDALDNWQSNSDVKFIILQGAGDRAFCVGGDVRSVYQAKHNGDDEYLDEYFRKEYTLVHRISNFPKPFISLIDGICMGGGIGLSIYGNYRVLSERAKLAMPEMKIGFFTDIGATYFLNNAPGYVGTMLALVGAVLDYQDAIFAGWGTHHVPHDNFTELRSRLFKLNTAEDIELVLQELSQPIHSVPLQNLQPLIDSCFKFDRVEDTFDALRSNGSEQALIWLNQLKSLSPISLKVELALLRRHRGMALKDVIMREFRACQRFMRGHDFFEGVRALLVEKDKNPNWSHASINKVTNEMVEEYFTPLMEKELEL